MTRFLVSGLLIAALLAGCGGSAGGAANPTQATATPSATRTTEPAQQARKDARALQHAGRYAAAAGALAAAGLGHEAARVRRTGARALARSARRALTRGHFKTAKRLASDSRRLHRTSAATAVISSADTGIAQAEAAAREQRRLEALARDQRTCSSSEQATVRADGGTPAGCATYAADLSARRAKRAQAQQEQTASCDPNYSGACLKPDSADYDCEGGSGNGPDYTGTVEVVGDDHYGLDADGDGEGCEG